MRLAKRQMESRSYYWLGVSKGTAKTSFVRVLGDALFAISGRDYVDVVDMCYAKKVLTV